MSPAATVQLPRKVEHPSVAERRARGRAARNEFPRVSHGEWEPAAGRPDPIDVLQRQAETRVPELIPIRYGRMMVSPFTFYRGAAAIMAADLAATPRSGLMAQLCGDAHLLNFGAYASPERQLLFDINDFDETLPGPWEWDVKRLAASFAIAARARGFSKVDRLGVVLDVSRHYREAIDRFAQMGNLEVWYSHVSAEDIMAQVRAKGTKKRALRLEATIAKAESRDNLQAFSKLTEIVDGEPRIKAVPPIVVPIEDLVTSEAAAGLEDRLRAVLRGYRRTLTTDRRHLLEQFRLVHVARKVVGVGSVGTRAWVALLLGRDGEDPLFLQFKEAQPSVLEEHIGRSGYPNAGQRVVAGQRLMQAASDIFLGWHRVEGIDGRQRDFYVRQLRDWKGSADVETMMPAGMSAYAWLCGWTLARAHARSGDRVAIAAYLGKSDAFDRAIADFAEVYADQNERDHAALVEAVKTGRVPAETGI
jgi:uncharacterized protein (DUF2252 family)